MNNSSRKTVLFHAVAAIAAVALFVAVGSQASAEGKETAGIKEGPQIPGLGELREKVESETVAEMVRNLEMSPELIFAGPEDAFDGVRFFQKLASVPRMAKMLDIAQNGTPEERQLLKKECLEGCQRYLKELPGYPPSRDGRFEAPTVVFAATAYLPYVLVELEQSREVMAIAVDMNDHYQDMMRRWGVALGQSADPSESHKWVGSAQVQVWAAVCDRVLRRIAQDTQAVSGLNAEQRAALEDYRKLEENRVSAQKSPQDFATGEYEAILKSAKAFVDAGR
jgi:hypothetical protein